MRQDDNGNFCTEQMSDVTQVVAPKFTGSYYQEGDHDDEGTLFGFETD